VTADAEELEAGTLLAQLTIVPSRSSSLNCTF
jgi:hypothetical protein